MRAVIVASGPSAKGFFPPAGVTVIAVNGAVNWLSRVDYFFTLDPSKLNLDRMLRYTRPGVVYCYAHDRDLQLDGCHYYRRDSSLPFVSPERGSPKWWANRWGSKLTLACEPGVINTGNSAWGALGLALHLGASKVALVGVDASQQPRIEGGASNNLSHLPLLFESALGQINFINCGDMRSAVPAMSIGEGMKWLTR